MLSFLSLCMAVADLTVRIFGLEKTVEKEDAG